jgi:shikimate kinase
LPDTTLVRHIVLLGLMGAGKTTVGEALAARLGWPLRDSDADLQATTGRSGRELDEERGTAELHRLEAGHLIDAIGAPRRSVICAAASTIDDPDARAALARPDLLVVWLRAEPATLARRIRPIDHRRRLGPDAAAALTAQAVARYPRFAALSPTVVDVDGVAVPEIIATILERLEAAGS